MLSLNFAGIHGTHQEQINADNLYRLLCAPIAEKISAVSGLIPSVANLIAQYTIDESRMNPSRSSIPAADLLPPCSQTISRPVNIFKTYESRYLASNHRRPPSMAAFTDDAPLVEELLARWTLDSSMCFFDLLCFDIYDHWKRQEAQPADLLRFCKLSKRLSVGLMEFTTSLVNLRLVSIIRNAFQEFGPKIPQSVQPKFTFLLKVLALPDQAIQLGLGPVELFGRNEVLRGDRSEREDVVAFLDFACQMHPQELSFIRTTQTDSALSKKINEAIQKIVDTGSADAEINDRCNLLIILKKIVNERLLQKKIPIERLVENIRSIDSFLGSKYKSWIQKMMNEHLGCNFNRKALAYVNFFYEPKRGGAEPFSLNKAQHSLGRLANECRFPKLNLLEQGILKKLDYERENCKDPEQYAAIFAEMVHLYQIIHDIRFLKDATKEQLEERHIPDSFAERAFLPITEASEINAAPMNIHLPVSLPDLPSLAEPKDVPSVRKIKVKTHGEPVISKEEIKGESSVAVSTAAQVIERPDFPTRNVRGEEVISHLLNNGFLIRRTTGGHYQMEHAATHVQTTVPYHESLRPGTLASIRDAFYRSQGFAR